MAERKSHDAERALEIKDQIEAHIARLKERYPGVIREDAQYFIYDVTDSEGNQSEIHTPKWAKIPVQIENGPKFQVPVWDVIETHLEYRHQYGADDYSLADALRKAGRLP